MIDAKGLIGTHNILFITLDTLRYDVACLALKNGKTPFLSTLLPNGEWEKRQTPSNFTLPAHLAFFTGFLPTPSHPGCHPRLFAVRFPDYTTINERTAIFDSSDIVNGLALLGYHTICIGGVGFFNKRTPLGCILPNLFMESHWSPNMGVLSKNSTENQVKLAIKLLKSISLDKRIFLFINISAIHKPSSIFLPNSKQDSLKSQEAALNYVDMHLPPLFEALQNRGNLLVIICSDHGEAFGENGYFGHRLNHSVVLDVPYAEFILPVK